MDAPSPPHVSPPPSASPISTAWPRSAQLTTAFLLGVCVTLLAVQLTGSLRWNSRPAEFERGALLTYRIDLNHAERAELLQLPGVGPALVDRIEDHRRQRGPFKTVDELAHVHGVGPATMARLRPWICVKFDESEEENEPAETPSPVLRKPTTSAMGSGKKELTGTIDVNRATLEELQKLPGVGPKTAQKIVDERTKAPFKTVDELRRVSGIGPKTLEKLRPHVRVHTETVAVATE
ncbi:MAG: helix-hairpin-helix domain-containing protein [Gemmataceae bacterium]|nr:helix-hairpin-helix domain-containing protein [Gemmataceae bacterium]